MSITIDDVREVINKHIPDAKENQKIYICTPYSKEGVIGEMSRDMYYCLSRNTVTMVSRRNGVETGSFEYPANQCDLERILRELAK